MSLYSLKGVRQAFDGRTVLDIDELELSVGAGYALLGPNGCGKTTLLHILAFLRPPTRGEIYFKGQRVNWSGRSLNALRRRVVLVDQHPIMFTTSVLKNVEYGLKMRGGPYRERRKIALENLDRVGMSALASRPAHRLSGGETQRVALARAMACSPDVMLFDEPTANVDMENQGVIENLIKEIHKERGISIVFATHRRLEAARLADDRIFMFEGKLMGAGGGNLLSGTIERRNGRLMVCLAGGKVKLELDSPLDSSEEMAAGSGRPARVFIRPEGIRIFPLESAGCEGKKGFFPGRVLQMTAEGEYLEILLDVGVFVRTLMSREEAGRTGILAGDGVRVTIEPGAVRLKP